MLLAAAAAAALRLKQGLSWRSAPVCIGSPTIFHSPHACSSPVSRRSRVGGTQCVYYPAPRHQRLQLGSAVQPQQARYGCVIVRGDSWRLENKTRTPRLETVLSGEKHRQLRVHRDGSWAKTSDGYWRKKYFQSSDASLGVEKNKPAEAPGSGDSVSRLSWTGKPATKAGRSPRLGISGAPSLSLLPSVGVKHRNRAFSRNYVLPQLLVHIRRVAEDQYWIKSVFVYVAIVSLGVFLIPSVAFSHTNKGALSAKSRENTPSAVNLKMHIQDLQGEDFSKYLTPQRHRYKKLKYYTQTFST